MTTEPPDEPTPPDRTYTDIAPLLADIAGRTGPAGYKFALIVGIGAILHYVKTDGGLKHFYQAIDDIKEVLAPELYATPRAPRLPTPTLRQAETAQAMILGIVEIIVTEGHMLDQLLATWASDLAARAVLGEEFSTIMGEIFARVATEERIQPDTPEDDASVVLPN